MTRHEDRDIRVADFLDDKLQTLADLDSLDALLLSVREQHTLLRKQLDDAERDYQKARDALSNHTKAIASRKRQLEGQQSDIDRRLEAVTQSNSSDEALSKFEAGTELIRRLDAANGYIELLQELDKTGDQCLSNLGKDDGMALEAYQRLYTMASGLAPLQETDASASHVVDYVSGRVKDLRQKMEATFSSQLQSVLKDAGWPSVDANIPDTKYDEFGTIISKLLDLQLPELEAEEHSTAASQGRQSPLVLLPLKILVHPLELGFRYHFEGNKPTNKLERPEFFLSHVTDKLLPQYSDFMINNVQPCLTQFFKGTPLAFNSAYLDVISAFITALLPMVRAKVFSILPEAAQQPHIFSHLIHELMKFDDNLRDDWQYDGGSTTAGWRGLTWEVLSTDEWFAKWLKVEKDFALARYEEIIAAPDSFDIDFESVPSGSTKPTKAAIRIDDLINTTTDHYRNLSSFSQKLRFLIDIQINIFDMFHERLADTMRTYVARTTTIGRTSREDQAALQGLPGLETLCKIYGSAEYLEDSMRDWSDDVFFLELWSELQYRAEHRERGKPVAGAMTLAEVAQKTSTTIGTDEGESSGSIFDETAASYNRLRLRVEHIVVELLQNSIRQSLAAYARINPWASLTPVSSAAPPQQLPPPTSELDALLSSLDTLLGFLARALGPLPLLRIARQAAHAVDAQLFDNVFLRHSFSAAGAAQMSADIAAVRAVFAKHGADAAGEHGLARSAEAASLLSVPVRGGRADGDGEMGALPEEESEGEQKREWGLWEVESRVIKSGGEEAREFLANEMGIEKISVGEARKILARKVELAG